MHTDYTGQNDVLTRIFLAGVERVNPEELIRSRLSLKDQSLVIAMRDDRSVCDLSSCRRILVLGAGKASARMARGLEDVLGGRITDGLISVKYGHTERLDRIRTIEAGHPVPDMNSERAAEEILSLASRADEETLVILLMSGGGSSLLCLPRTDSPIRITLEEKQETTKLLLSCGATIGEINCVRKHLSGIKGGRLAQAIFPARCLNLILSDVVGDRLIPSPLAPRSPIPHPSGTRGSFWTVTASGTPFPGVSGRS